MNPSSPSLSVRLLLDALVAIVLFFLSFIVGLGIAAAPGNMDSGMAVILLLPVYGLVALGTVPIAFFTRRMRQKQRSHAGDSRFHFRQLGPLALAVTTALGLFLALYYPLNALADRSNGGNGYLLAIACAPLVIALPAGLGGVIFRWSYRTLFVDALPGSFSYGALGVAGGLVAHYPALMICSILAAELSHAQGYNTNVDSFVAGILCWPFVTGPSFLLGLLGGLAGIALTGGGGRKSEPSRGGTRLPALAAAVLAGAAGPLLYLLPLTVGILEDWRLN